MPLAWADALFLDESKIKEVCKRLSESCFGPALIFCKLIKLYVSTFDKLLPLGHCKKKIQSITKLFTLVKQCGRSNFPIG